MLIHLFNVSKTRTLGTPCQAVKRYLLILAGCVSFSVGVACFYEPSSLAPGGVSGIALIIHAVFPLLPIGFWLLVINVPLILIGAKIFGRRFFIDTLFAVGVSALFTDIFSSRVNALTHDAVLGATAGGVLVALGLGIVLRCGATTGGVDIAVKLLKLRLRHVNTGIAFLAFDGAVVLTSWVVLGDVDAALYSVLALAAQTVVLDKILYGADGAMLVYVISVSNGRISERARAELDVGATMLYGQGEHTGKSREILLIVVRPRRLPAVRDIIKEEDAAAFVIVTRSVAVFGNGFKDHFVEEL